LKKQASTTDAMNGPTNDEKINLLFGLVFQRISYGETRDHAREKKLHTEFSLSMATTFSFDEP
jgi:hypothetical protein